MLTPAILGTLLGVPSGPLNKVVLYCSEISFKRNFTALLLLLYAGYCCGYHSA